jgi:hypothetical protein
LRNYKLKIPVLLGINFKEKSDIFDRTLDTFGFSKDGPFNMIPSISTNFSFKRLRRIKLPTPSPNTKIFLPL